MALETPESLRAFLERKVEEYNQPAFIKDDPVFIPHMFSKKQDIEIAGLFAALFAWGNRTTIINKGKELMQAMDMSPYDFVRNHSPSDLKALLNFRHRTFNATDLLYFIEFFNRHYSTHKTLEKAFFAFKSRSENPVEDALNHFYEYFTSHEDFPNRTKKHVSRPANNSSCKRLNMYLRWMVRNDDRGVDFGIWKSISPSELVCPVDVHVARVARRFNILQRKTVDWLAALELTEYLKTLDPADPVKFDFALFGLGIMERY